MEEESVSTEYRPLTNPPVLRDKTTKSSLKIDDLKRRIYLVHSIIIQRMNKIKIPTIYHISSYSF